MRELDDRNSDDCAVRSKIVSFCLSPSLVHMTRTADTDLGIAPATKDALLEAVREHITAKRRMFTDRMDNSDTAFIITECTVEETVLYVKVKFFRKGDAENMLIISAHPPRRWC